MSRELTETYGKGFSVSNIQFMRRFYLAYEKQQTLSVKLSWSHYCELLIISILASGVSTSENASKPDGRYASSNDRYRHRCTSG
ncbi:MAG: DUF1016 N-terminal domain-containing protein [Gordonibacter pamelaeae]